MKKLLLIAGFGLFAAHAGAVNAASLFNYNFDADAAGGTLLSWPGNSTWTVADGSVDLIKSPDYGLTCFGGSGGCIDLDGSGDAGVLSTTLNLTAGQAYSLTAQISRSPAGSGLPQTSENTVRIRATNGIQNFFTDIGPLPSGSIDYQLATLNFSAGATGLFTLSFENLGSDPGDYVGAMLDSVDVSTVPLPAAAWLLLSGLGALGAVARRRKETAS